MQALITIRHFTSTGHPLPSIAPQLDRSECAVRIQKSLAKGASAGDSLADLDAGTIRLSTVAKIFTQKEIEAAVRLRLAGDDVLQDERDTLTSLLENPSWWRVAQGGERACAPDRFGIRNGYDGSEPETRRGTPAGSKVPGDTPLEEAQAARGARAIAKSRGWRPSEMSGETMRMHHPGRPGEELVIGGAGGWLHSERGGYRKSGGANEMEGHLDRLHFQKREVL